MKRGVFIAILIGVLSFIFNATIRHDLLQNSENQVVLILAGSYANFTATFGLSLLIASFLKEWKRKVMVVIGIVLSQLFREVESFESMAGGEGNTFDYYDIAATLIGGFAAYFVMKNYGEFLEKKLFG